MSADEFSIEPSTKVAALLDRFPELEDVLIEMAPPFKKLRNPILRRSVAKVASLRHAAAAGRVPVDELVNRLRAEVGQEAIASEDAVDTDSYFSSQPDWFDPTKIVASIDEREASDPDKMTVVAVLQRATSLQPTEMVELITTFLPAPGIDIMKGKGFLVWSVQEKNGLIRTYFSKPAPA
jgi:hypothetical protein